MKALLRCFCLMVGAGITFFQCNAQTSAGQSINIVNIPADGWVMARLDLANVKPAGRTVTPDMRPIVSNGGSIVTSQWIPDPDFGKSNYTGTLVLLLKGKRNFTGTFVLGKKDDAYVSRKPVNASTSVASFVFSPGQNGFFPQQVKFNNGDKLTDFSWNDRLYDKATGSFYLHNANVRDINVVSSGGLVTVIRSTAAYTDNNGNAASGTPSAIYDWYFFKGLPSFYVKAWQTTTSAMRWQESHFIEWNFRGKIFNTVSGDTRSEAPLDGGKQTLKFGTWAALANDNEMVGVINTRTSVYDGYKDYGTYIHVQDPDAWSGWDGKPRQFDAWLWATPASQGTASLIAALSLRANSAIANITTPVDQLAKQSSSAVAASSNKEWNNAVAQQYSAVLSSRQAVSDKTDGVVTLHQVSAGNLGLAINVAKTNAQMISVFDLGNQRELSAGNASPLFSLELYNAADKKTENINAEDTWDRCDWIAADDGFKIQFSITKATGISLEATVSGKPDKAANAWHWQIKVVNKSKKWAVSRVQFPQFTAGNFGAGTKVFYPTGPGIEQQHPYYNWSYNGAYPGGWASMQYMAIYNPDQKIGIYIAREDPTGATKNLLVQSHVKDASIDFGFVQPAENMASPGNSFDLTGDGVWTLFSGNWYDASLIYRKWALNNASWTKKTKPQTGFEDEDIWAILNGNGVQVATQAKKMQALFPDAKIGVHWYNWHEIPFDNDYPHYFPAKAGFEQGISQLKSAGIFVLPYINGRLWDTNDGNGANNSFTAHALPGSVKTVPGNGASLKIETYGSKEKDGSDVKMAVMCPYTPLWQDTLQHVIQQLSNLRVSGVYVDQVASSEPVLCMDASHGHPLGGGHWWVDGYNQLFSSIKTRNPALALAVEDNAEPYMQYADAYLTWHWQFDGQVPAFPAVYNDKVILFGRSFSTGEGSGISFRLKLAQALSFGEEIGWLDPNILFQGISNANLAFVKQVVQCHHQFSTFFTKGRLMRPPVLNGDVPEISIKLSPTITTVSPAVISSAWSLADARKMIIIFSNISDQQVNANFNLAATAYNLPAGWKVSATDDNDTPVTAKGTTTLPIKLPPATTRIWVVSW